MSIPTEEKIEKKKKNNHASVYTLAALLLGAVVMRLIALNQSLWLDEATTAQVVRTLSFTQIIHDYAPNDFHPPLYYLFLKIWTSIFGYTEVSLRMPSVLFSLLTGWLVYEIVLLSGRKRPALWAAAYVWYNPLLLYYSQEARMYLLATFLLTAAYYSFLILRKYLKLQIMHEIVMATIAINLCLGLSFVTFYGSAFGIATFFLYMLIRREWNMLALLAPGPLVALILGAPLLQTQLNMSKEALQLVPNWSLVLGTVTGKNLLLIPLKFAAGRISFEPSILYLAIGGLWTGIVALFVSLGSMSNKSKPFLFFLMTPLLLGIVFSFYAPMLQYFRFVYLLPYMAILIALGASMGERRNTPLLPAPIGKKLSHLPIHSLLLAGFLAWCMVYVTIPAFHREDWKNLAQKVEQEKKTIAIVSSASDPLSYYAADLSITDLRTLTQQPPQDEHIIVVPYVSDIHGIAYQDSLQNYGYQLIRTQVVRGLSYEVWERN